jgi:hypothetical protein
MPGELLKIAPVVVAGFAGAVAGTAPPLTFSDSGAGF